jgi:hypothetical protein
MDEDREDAQLSNLSRRFWQLAIEQGANSGSLTLTDRAHFDAAVRDLQGLEITSSEENSVVSNNPEAPKIKPYPRRSVKMGRARLRTFYGRQDGIDDPEEFIRDIQWSVRREYAQEIAATKEEAKALNLPPGQKSDAQQELEREIEEECKSEFRNHLAEDALAWLGRIEKSVRSDWKKLSAACIERFSAPEESEQAREIRMEAEYDSMKQGDREEIGDYLKRATEFYDKFGTKKPAFGRRVVQGLSYSRLSSTM